MHDERRADCSQWADRRLIALVSKRDSSLKDFGNILSIHGGIIDRFDGLIFTVPIFYYYLSFTY
jgi:CDP-diglyceride synthetase